MTHVFISYKREDEARVGRLARTLAPMLKARDVDLWWDRSLAPAGNWHLEIERQLNDAGAVLVVWTHGSVGVDGHYVRDEARVGQHKGVLVPVLFDNVKIPTGFGEVQAIDMVAWRGSARDPALHDLADTLLAKTSGSATPAPRARKTSLARRLALGGGSMFGLGVLVAILFNLFGAASLICHAPGLQPALGDLCGAARVGDMPNREDRIAWAALHSGVCEDLRDYINRFPSGKHAAEASRRYHAAIETRTTRWRTETRTLPIRLDGAALLTSRDRERAHDLCSGLAGSLFSDRGAPARFVSVDFPRCANGGCAPPILAACTLQTPYPEIVQTCPTPTASPMGR